MRHSSQGLPRSPWVSSIFIDSVGREIETKNLQLLSFDLQEFSEAFWHFVDLRIEPYQTGAMALDGLWVDSREFKLVDSMPFEAKIYGFFNKLIAVIEDLFVEQEFRSLGCDCACSPFFGSYMPFTAAIAAIFMNAS